jgi:hypothetical protein
MEFCYIDYVSSPFYLIADSNARGVCDNVHRPVPKAKVWKCACGWLDYGVEYWDATKAGKALVMNVLAKERSHEVREILCTGDG